MDQRRKNMLAVKSTDLYFRQTSLLTYYLYICIALNILFICILYSLLVLFIKTFFIAGYIPKFSSHNVHPCKEVSAHRVSEE